MAVTVTLLYTLNQPVKRTSNNEETTTIPHKIQVFSLKNKEQYYTVVNSTPVYAERDF